ncbi:hypothetical protein DSL72_004477 [Monilinia vaccinii-corymbosi]|uniref:non-specific serine/threonine protein kinase n=1 Tax=Monilinia vaccinii-corymbosi TaxID=61207 RepID=A0A8A3P8T9_9HELO|nr:hypothetical protein DSL72_004477 [Monilinia vaccinii-corymbosi]
MASSIELEIISQNPIKNENLRIIATSTSSKHVVNPGIFSMATSDSQSMISLLVTLQDELAARRLRSRLRNGSLAGDLTALYGLLDGNASCFEALKGSKAHRKPDIFLVSTDAPLPNGLHDWSTVLVVGEHKQNTIEDHSQSTLLQLADYAREAFGSQPGRRFVPGFTICGSWMRLWIFDRSGPYSSEKFDIHQEPERFVRIISGYALMSDSELGLNTFIKCDEIGRYIIARDINIYLEDKPIASHKAIVSRGTTCYRGRKPDSSHYEYVVKFAWPSGKQLKEGRLLKLAKRGVKGIAEWFHDEQVTIDGCPDTIAYLRRDMEFGVPEKASSKASWIESSENNRCFSRSKSLHRGRSRTSAGRLTDRMMTTGGPKGSLGRKRKRDQGDSSGIKRFKLGDSGIVTKVNEHGSDLNAVQGPDDGIEENEVDSLVGEETETYVKELLEVFRDAIAGHRSLLEDGKILHRDISEYNIIIMDPGTKDEPKGRLIDLGLAKELHSTPSGASHRTGTMQFMAIEVLEGQGHTYRHDLESFFYVFIWMCVRYGHEDTSASGKLNAGRNPYKHRTPRSMQNSILQDWYTGNYMSIANKKRGHMTGFHHVTAEFSPQFQGLKGLARELKDVLFPYWKGSTFFGTWKDTRGMYEGMLKAFDNAIKKLDDDEDDDNY